MLTNKTKILWWVIALLAILNITTIATIVVHNNNEREAEMDQAIQIEPNAQPINGKYFRHELGFDNEQMEVFRQSNRTFRHKANRIVVDIDTQKELMFQELQAANPDTVKLHTFSQQIGLLHTELKDATMQFYLSLNAICDKEQKEKMKEIFTPLFINIPVKNGEGCRHGNPNNN